MKLQRYLYLGLLLTIFLSCNSKKSGVPVVGFVDAFEDVTVGQARTGFTNALKQNGLSEEKGNLKIEYKNAQNDQPTLSLIVNQFVSEKVDLMATCTTLSTITALQKTKTIPVFAMVSPVPSRMNVLSSTGAAPPNLFGALEDLNYIDTSFNIITTLLKPKGNKLVIGMIYNQSEPQSVDAVNRIKGLAAKSNVSLEVLPLNNSADAQLVTKSLLSRNIDSFFALPDNSVFASFETIVKNCNQANVPVFTSEAGLVKLGAVAAYGADMYQWGYQAGEQAAQYLRIHKTDGLKWEMVKVRKRVYNPEAAAKYHISIPSNFEALK
ncbi:MAG: ABC transporter substrate-binding protein [Bacteroidetes bacterium]|nr:ABC transporter substrate-binding protein [Bacteroidota bacterium]